MAGVIRLEPVHHHSRLAIDNRANRRAIELLVEHFNIPKTQVKLTNGTASHYKTIEAIVHDDENIPFLSGKNLRWLGREWNK